ncbi:MAG: VOC family protein [Actinomycetota bacterium]|nr:VOC family protein [Actinomycetota bacterium]
MTHNTPAATDLRIAALAFDCREPAVLAPFWAALLGGTVEFDSVGDATVHLPGAPGLDFIRVPEPKSVKNRLHLDLRGASYDDAIGTALALGAGRADDIYDGGSWQVLRDPEDNEFCILRPARS